MQDKPEIKDDPMFQLLKQGKIKKFNQRKAAGDAMDLTHGDFRGLDLRDLDADGLDLRCSYFHQTDLRGLDLRKTNLEGASINGARIAGAYFPAELSAEEINLSLMHGTRMRYRS
ncbi:MAG: pentapeptide repeat-containing protein [Gammaproteobacteria bacterium]